MTAPCRYDVRTDRLDVLCCLLLFGTVSGKLAAAKELTKALASKHLDADLNQTTSTFVTVRGGSGCKL